MDYVNCSGSEVRLWDCPHFTHSYSGCSHSDDAGVRCRPGMTWIECRLNKLGNYTCSLHCFFSIVTKRMHIQCVKKVLTDVKAVVPFKQYLHQRLYNCTIVSCDTAVWFKIIILLIMDVAKVYIILCNKMVIW